MKPTIEGLCGEKNGEWWVFEWLPTNNGTSATLEKSLIIDENVLGDDQCLNTQQKTPAVNELASTSSSFAEFPSDNLSCDVDLGMQQTSADNISLTPSVETPKFGPNVHQNADWLEETLNDFHAQIIAPLSFKTRNCVENDLYIEVMYSCCVFVLSIDIVE